MNTNFYVPVICAVGNTWTRGCVLTAAGVVVVGKAFPGVKTHGVVSPKLKLMSSMAISPVYDSPFTPSISNCKRKCYNTTTCKRDDQLKTIIMTVLQKCVIY